MMPRRPIPIQWQPAVRVARALFAATAGACVVLMSTAAWSANSCSVAATTHAFGAYDTINPLSGTSSITLTCIHTTNPAVTFNYTIALSSGSGSYAARQMTGAGDTLNFNHYTTAAHTTVWGNGTGGTVTVSGSLAVPSGSNNSRSTTVTVYGLIGGPQNVTPAALYSTVVPITVTVTGNFTGSTTTFNTTSSVAAKCTVSAANLSFGAIDPLNSQVDATTALTVKCTKNSPYTVGLDAGVTTGATIAQRKMANGADIMNYNLYTNAARTTIWGNTAVAPSWVSGTGAGLAIAQTLTVYGRVASGQTNLAVGNFQENTVTVTVTY
jgi:spore coat protein U-like protein